MLRTRSATAVAALALVSSLALGVGSPAEAAPVAKPQTVTIVATMKAPATVTYSGNGIVSQKQRSGTWSRTFTRHSFTYYSVDVSSFDGGNTVGCVIKVNGKVIRKKSASGDSFASVSCSYATS